MSVGLQEQSNAEYAIDDPQILYGEVEIYIASPFDASHLIYLTRQLEKHGYTVQHSSGSFRHGCLMTMFMEEPANIVEIIADAPGIQDVRITEDSEERPEGINHQLSHRHFSERLGVHRIAVTTEPPKGQIRQRLEALDGSGKHLSTTRSSRTDDPEISPPTVSGERWERLITLDVRHKALRR